MLALCIILVILLLILILPVGVDAAYLDGVFTLKARAGPVKIGILPAREKTRKKKKPKPEKEKEPRPEREKKAEGGKKRKLGLNDILELVKIALRALSRFRKALSIDVFLLHFLSASEDPYNAVMQYGYLNAGLSALSPLFHRVLKIRNEDIRTAVDMEPGRPVIELRIVATLQIWEILYIGICAGFAFLRWYLRKKKEAKAASKAQPVEQKG